VAGAVGGLVGSWTMNQFQAAISKLKSKDGAQQPQSESEDATMKAAGKVVRLTAHRELSQEQKKKLGPVVHYAFGAGVAAVYGAVTEQVRHLNPAAGLAFGGALWATADELAVPVFGLSEGPTKYPASVHLNALAAHLVYGETAEMVRRGMRALLR
jgi:uncharacterized membrane protein YagU involved in acid resistance